MTALPQPSGPTEGASSGAAESDAALLERVRAGDKRAYGVLWDRHHRAGLGAARAITSAFDADDLVSEAFVRVLKAIERGNGPTAAFRPYLVTTIRSVAARWGAQPAELTPEDFEAVDPDSSEEAFADRFDQSLTVRAFNSLPQRWQEVLWYTEAEQLPPREVAAMIGIKPNAVSALAKRAKEGLRHAWVQAHIATVPAGSECRWAVDRLAVSTRKSLSAREQERLDAHLDECDRCPLAAAEMTEASHRLGALILIGFLGAGAATGYAAFLKPAAATAATLGVGAGAGAAASKPAFLGNLAVVGGSVVVAGAIAAGVAFAVTGGSNPPAVAGAPAATSHAAPPPATTTDASPAAPAASDPATSAPAASEPSASTAPGDANDAEEPPTAAAGAGSVAPVAPAVPETVPSSPPVSDPPASDPGSTPPSDPSTPPSGSTPGDPTSSPAALVVTTVDTGDGGFYPIVSGTGDVGATITITDGTTSVSTSVAADGSFTAPVFEWVDAAATDALTVTQTTVAGVSSQLTENVTLDQPSMIAVLAIAEISGAAGAQVDVLADGALSSYTIGALGIILTTVPITDDSIQLRYSDGTRFGPWSPNLAQIL